MNKPTQCKLPQSVFWDIAAEMTPTEIDALAASFAKLAARLHGTARASIPGDVVGVFGNVEQPK